MTEQPKLLRSISLQPVYKTAKIERTVSENGYTPQAPQGMSMETRDIKIAQLEDFINKAIDIANGNDNYTADEILTQDDKGKQAKFFYFIGRLNPPHNGHIKALQTLVETANEQRAIPLILLGSGPGGERTMDNPITFETKEAFIRMVLPGNYIIRKMTNPAKNVSDYISEGLQQLNDTLEDIQEVTITHIAGGKDEDTTKLSFALTSAEKTARGIAPKAEVITGVRAIDAESSDSGEAMSATKVRKDAYRTVLNETGFVGWPQQYKQFYGPFAEQIYNEILFPLKEKTKEERNNVIDLYIEQGILPGSKKRKSDRKGGTKRKPRKNKRKMKTKKRKISRRVKHQF